MVASNIFRSASLAADTPVAFRIIGLGALTASVGGSIHSVFGGNGVPEKLVFAFLVPSQANYAADPLRVGVVGLRAACHGSWVLVERQLKSGFLPALLCAFGITDIVAVKELESYVDRIFRITGRLGAGGAGVAEATPAVTYFKLKVHNGVESDTAGRRWMPRTGRCSTSTRRGSACPTPCGRGNTRRSSSPASGSSWSCASSPGPTGRP